MHSKEKSTLGYEDATPQVETILLAIAAENSREELQAKLKLADRRNFKKLYLIPAIDAGLIERTILLP